MGKLKTTRKDLLIQYRIETGKNGGSSEYPERSYLKWCEEKYLEEINNGEIKS